MTVAEMEFDADQCSLAWNPYRKGSDGLNCTMRRWLHYYLQTASQSEAFRMMRADGHRVSRGQLTQWKKYNPRFLREFNKTRGRVRKYLEFEARRRAVVGVKRLKFHKGRAIRDPRTGKPYYETEYSDQLLVMLLKANFPEKYRDRSDVNLSGSLNLTNISDAELEERERRLGLEPPRFVLPTAEKATN